MPQSRTRSTTRRNVVTALGAALAVPMALPLARLAEPTHGAEPRRLAGTVSLPDFRRDGDRGDTPALKRALAAGHRAIHLPAGAGSGLDGAYMIGMDAMADGFGLPSGTRIVGDGASTLIRPQVPSTGAVFDAISSSPRAHIDDLVFENFRVAGYVETHFFEEHAHIFRLNGVRNARLANLEIAGFQGDGLYLGSGLRLGDERHNRDVVIDNCHFDGITSNNRNAISVIDCEGLQVANCTARRVTREGDGTPRPIRSAAEKRNRSFGLGMPGALVFEPDGIGDFSRLRNISVRNWRVEDCGGSAIAFNLRDNRTLAVPIGHILCSEIVARRCVKGISANGYVGTGALEDAAAYAIAIQGFLVQETAYPYHLDGMTGFALDGQAEDCGTAMLGVAGGSNRDVRIRMAYLRCAGRDAPNPGVVVRVGASTRNLDLSGSQFNECGYAGLTGTNRLIYVTGGRQTSLILRNLSARAGGLGKGRPLVLSMAGGSNVVFSGLTTLEGATIDWAPRDEDLFNRYRSVVTSSKHATILGATAAVL